MTQPELTAKQRLMIYIAEKIPVGTRVGGIEVRDYLSTRAGSHLIRFLFGLSNKPASQRRRTIWKGSQGLEALDARVARNLEDPRIKAVRDEIVTSLESPEILFDYCVAVGAKTIVELGTRMCNSTNALVRAASLTGGRVYSYDPAMFRGRVDVKYHPFWEFHQYTGEDGYRVWDKNKKVDVLFVDTDPHTFEQTQMWLSEYWFQVLAPGALILLDDAGAAFQGFPHTGEVNRGCRDFLERHPDQVDFLVIEDDAPPANGVAALKLKAP
ncbi:class I SAM-dependent methyltransferase [Archangium violaceum]|uniref:class I SAM-dependent methyltransferase n=1 Tax=Archangium violaceum TaxID=83451 RepID=UPI00194EA741|nr:class I SAM-dependent methyltransferase [Archangium violaceum]QRO01906.1 class I SAM-dependent methyltransferase [Archangium violaceum]